MERDKGLELCLAVGGAVLLAEAPVEQLCGGPGDGREDDHGGVHHGRAEGADGEAVARTDALGHDLTKHDDEEGGGEHGGDSASKVGEEDGQRLVDNDVAEQQHDEHPVATLFEELEHLGRVLSFLFGAGGGQDLEVDHVEAHETEGEAGEDAAEHDERGDGEDVDGEFERVVAHRVVLLVVVARRRVGLLVGCIEGECRCRRKGCGEDRHDEMQHGGESHDGELDEGVCARWIGRGCHAVGEARCGQCTLRHHCRCAKDVDKSPWG